MGVLLADLIVFGLLQAATSHKDLQNNKDFPTVRFMGIHHVLIQDEEGLIHHLLADRRLDITLSKNLQSTFVYLQEKSFDMVICDELEVIKRAKMIHPQIIAVYAPAFATIENAAMAMRLGAFDFLTPPVDSQMLEAIFERARALKKEIPCHSRGKIEQIIADSSVMKQILTDIGKISKSNASVFISGESGTGKEVIAHAIHFQSDRASHPFIKVNCAAIPDSLIESEFFGHEKGAFTGATERRLGRFELANTGTLLLDEISEIPLAIQAKLLRVVQEQEFERVGGSKPIKVSVRLISTSNRNMKEAIEQKLFREDLYYRLNVVPIHLPPLRERREDIVSLAGYFLERFCLENHKRRKILSPAAQKMLLDYRWPGNIRELANIIERTVVMNDSEVIEPPHMGLESCPVSVSYTGMTLAEVEKRVIDAALAKYKNNRTHTAKALGISIRTLRNKLKSR